MARYDVLGGGNFTFFESADEANSIDFGDADLGKLTAAWDDLRFAEEICFTATVDVMDVFKGAAAACLAAFSC